MAPECLRRTCDDWDGLVGVGRGIVLLIFFAGIARGGLSITGAASVEVTVDRAGGCRVSMVMVMAMVEVAACKLAKSETDRCWR